VTLSLARRAFGFVERHAVVIIAALSLAIRCFQNLIAHKPLDNAYSDMGGYVGRAKAIFDKPWAPAPDVTFFPYGTHFFVYGVERVFGRTHTWAVGGAFAVLGTLAVVIHYLAAKRLFSNRPRLALVVGFVLAVYVPWIKQGGFVLSEPPLAVAIAATTWLSLKLMDEGRTRDALLLGIAYAIGATFRPQLLFSAALALLLAAFTRRLWKAKKTAIVVAALPILLVLAGSAYRTHYHTGHYGPISTNGAFNFALGRCHSVELTASKTPGGSYTPPSFNGLFNYKKKHGIEPILELDPAFGEKLSYDAQLWDEDAAYAQAKKCIAKTGPLKQVKYSVTHVMLLWLYNGPWPSSGGVVTAVFAILHAATFLPGLALGLFFLIRRKNARVALIAMHVVALLATAMIFFGEARLRLPYDGVILTIAVYGYAEAWPIVASRIRRLRERRAARKGARTPEPSGATPSSARSSSSSRAHIFSNLTGARNTAFAPRR
jgi:hypothetical protein